MMTAAEVRSLLRTPSQQSSGGRRKNTCACQLPGARSSYYDPGLPDANYNYGINRAMLKRTTTITTTTTSKIP
jgi:hypothetical protein